MDDYTAPNTKITIDERAAVHRFAAPAPQVGQIFFVACDDILVPSVRRRMQKAFENVRDKHPDRMSDMWQPAHIEHHSSRNTERNGLRLGPLPKLIAALVEQEYFRLLETDAKAPTPKPFADIAADHTPYLNGLADQVKDRICAEAGLSNAQKGGFNATGAFHPEKPLSRFVLRVEYDHITGQDNKRVSGIIDRLTTHTKDKHASIRGGIGTKSGWLEIASPSLKDLSAKVKAIFPKHSALDTSGMPDAFSRYDTAKLR